MKGLEFPVSFYILKKKEVDCLVIKNFIDKVENLSTDAWLAILSHIDSKLDHHEDRLDKLEDKIDRFGERFEPTKAEIESQASTRKLIKKAGITAAVGIFVAFILKHFGVF